jgi:sec-independent protein translocase protein TatA
MATTLVPLFGPIPGGMEMFVILLIAVLLFGANKIPKLARSTGQAMGEFQKGRQQVEQELEEMEESMDPEAEISSGDDSTVNLDDENPDEEFEVDDESKSSS